jgi:hypothetical protein
MRMKRVGEKSEGRKKMRRRRRGKGGRKEKEKREGGEKRGRRKRADGDEGEEGSEEKGEGKGERGKETGSRLPIPSTANPRTRTKTPGRTPTSETPTEGREA